MDPITRLSLGLQEKGFMI